MVSTSPVALSPVDLGGVQNTLSNGGALSNAPIAGAPVSNMGVSIPPSGPILQGVNQNALNPQNPDVGSVNQNAPQNPAPLTVPGTMYATPATAPVQPSNIQPQSATPSGSNTSGVGTLALPQSSTTISSVQAPDAASDTAAYTAQVQQSLAPQFQQSQQQLAAQQAAMGTLSSGQGNKGLQDLYAQQNSTVAGLVAPMIQQGNAEQYGANTTNANNANAYQGQIQNEVYGAGQNQINNNLQAQEFNAGAANQTQLSELGYANSDYQQQMAELAGLQSQGLGGTLGTTNQGMNNQLNAYTSGYQNLMPYLQQTGVGQGYGTPGTGTNGTGLPNTAYGPNGGTDYTTGPGVVAPSPNEISDGGDFSAGWGDSG